MAGYLGCCLARPAALKVCQSFSCPPVQQSPSPVTEVLINDDPGQLVLELKSFSCASQQLATMQRVRKGSDDPAGLIAAEKLRAELRIAEETASASEQLRGAVHIAD